MSTSIHSPAARPARSSAEAISASEDQACLPSHQLRQRDVFPNMQRQYTKQTTANRLQTSLPTPDCFPEFPAVPRPSPGQKTSKGWSKQQ